MLEMALEYGATLDELLGLAGVSREEFEEVETSSILDRSIRRFGFECPITISIANAIENGTPAATLEKVLEFYENFF